MVLLDGTVIGKDDSATLAEENKRLKDALFSQINVNREYVLVVMTLLAKLDNKVVITENELKVMGESGLGIKLSKDEEDQSITFELSNINAEDTEENDSIDQNSGEDSSPEVQNES